MITLCVDNFFLTILFLPPGAHFPFRLRGILTQFRIKVNLLPSFPLLIEVSASFWLLLALFPHPWNGLFALPSLSAQ